MTRMKQLAGKIKDQRNAPPWQQTPGLLYGADNGLTAQDFARRIAKIGKSGVSKEYANICKEALSSSCTAFYANPHKNRYNDVPCLDNNRVILHPTAPGKPARYIHANYVDGYKQKQAYICTQGPLPETFVDFWRMVWQEHSVLIVALTKLLEGGKVKCSQYWPEKEGKKVRYGNYSVQTMAIDMAADSSYARSTLKLEDDRSNEHREVIHLLYLQWPDYGTPLSSNIFLTFREVVMRTQRKLLLNAAFLRSTIQPPIIVHCSAGVGRTGTLVALDICLRQLLDRGKFDVPGVVRRIRQQRSFSVQKADQYAFLNLGMLEYALEKGILKHDDADLSGFIEVETEIPIQSRPQLKPGEVASLYVQPTVQGPVAQKSPSQPKFVNQSGYPQIFKNRPFATVTFRNPLKTVKNSNVTKYASGGEWMRTKTTRA